ncbi:MAG: 2-phosphosulfolactate phosphatase [Synergistes sp.]|nr:2-phosphosulfolactate phosphatase [Synergistes sp.]
MKYVFDVAFLPSEKLKEHEVRIVVDLLRASTQITTFFDCGGSVLLPVKELKEAADLRDKLSGDWKVMGERGGVKPEDFDFGNSPVELMQSGAPDNAIITTSNGTNAILSAVSGCERVVVGCARNAESVCWDAICSGKNIGIICAGQNGEFSLEDSVCAGMMIEKLLALAPSNGADEMELTDGGMSALALWHSMGPCISEVCSQSAHGKTLSELGFDNDIFFCGEIDESSTVPLLTEKYGMYAIIGR